jgi:hypothetical protein
MSPEDRKFIAQMKAYAERLEDWALLSICYEADVENSERALRSLRAVARDHQIKFDNG